MHHHEDVLRQLAQDRSATFVHEAKVHALARRRTDRRPPPGHHAITRRARWRRRPGFAGQPAADWSG